LAHHNVAPGKAKGPYGLEVEHLPDHQPAFEKIAIDSFHGGHYILRSLGKGVVRCGIHRETMD
jgi:hypothetical protein